MSTTTGSNQDIVAECESVFNPHTCSRRGICPVTRTRHQRQSLQGHSLYFEVHGSGPQKVIFITGMNENCFFWLPQVEYFCKLEQYTILVVDNRGIGLSDCSSGLFSTSGMAEDILCLLNYLQWTEDRSLHIVGASMGGMIAQELAYRIPERIASLSLVVTRAARRVWQTLPVCFGLTRFFSIPDQSQRLQMMVEALLPAEWLDSLAKNDPEGRTNREIEVKFALRRAAITKPQTWISGFGQMAACMTHNMAPARLAKISASIPKVLIISGAEDRLMPPIEGEEMKRCMPEAEYQCWEEAGHGLPVQCRERLNQVLKRAFEQGREAAGQVH